MSNKKEIISTNNAPAAIGPYSQAVVCNGFMYLSGQIPLDPKTGEVVEGDITVQTNRVLDNIKEILKEKALGLDSVIKTTIFVTDLKDFVTVNNAYGEYFKEEPPVRSTVEVSALPKGVNIEIECIASLEL
ncbi:MAG: RidA family protein [Firmicutes bacterium]|nr:RidA family protein [Bacillota bacterium]